MSASHMSTVAMAGVGKKRGLHDLSLWGLPEYAVSATQAILRTTGPVR